MPYKDPERQKAAQAAWYQQNKKKTDQARNRSRRKLVDEIAEYKGANPCVDCGRIYPYYCMDFDHLDGSLKVGNVAHLVNWYGKDKVWDEIRKCDLVCSNCHRVRTFARRASRMATAAVSKAEVGQ